MKVKKSRIAEIVKEELGLYLGELLEANKDKKLATVGAEKENNKPEPETPSKNIVPQKGSKKEPEGGNLEKDTDSEQDKDLETQKEVPVGDDPSDDELSKDVVDPESDDESKLGGDVSKEVTGKTIQSITMEPKSKMMAGASEIVIQFDEIPHPLKILIGKSGMIKYVFKGSIHNEL